MDACVISAIFIVGCEVCNLEYDACTVQLVLQIDGKLYCMNKLGLFNSNSMLDRIGSYV